MGTVQAGFELWDSTSHNLMGDYDTEEQALAAVARAVAAHGRDYAGSIVLVRIGPRGGLRRISSGSRLVHRALNATPLRARPGLRYPRT